MLRNTFLHIPGVGKTTERRLWASGCRDWSCVLSDPARFSFGRAETLTVVEYLKKSEVALQEGHHQFFARRLGQRDAWRAYDDFKHSCVYLDIETDGGNSPASITTIGLYDGQTYRCLVQGEDLEDFRNLITQFSMIVTFFGTGFDIPVLQKAFRGILWDHLHLDLCPILRKLEMRGGLKKIEKELGIERSPETVGLNGYDAVQLWRRYRLRGDDGALTRLIAYNREDCVNLEKLAEHAFSKMKEQTLPADMQQAPAL